MNKKNYDRIYKMDFSSVYPLLLEKVLKKGRTKEELDTVITWLTGYKQNELEDILKDYMSYEDFFAKAPILNEKRQFIKGSICGVKLAEIDDALVKEVRYLDKLVDDLAKGKKIDKLLFEDKTESSQKTSQRYS